MPSFQNSFAPASPARLAAVENRLGVRFPADYRAFLTTVNGGQPTPDCFTVPGRGDVMLGMLYGIGPAPSPSDLEYEQELATLWDPLPSGWLAIGSDPGGNRVLLSTEGKDAGHVYFWDRVGFWVQDDGQNTFPVSPSFAAFLEMLWAGPE